MNRADLSLFPCVTSVIDIYEQLLFCLIYLGEPKGLHGVNTVQTKAQIQCFFFSFFFFTATEQESSQLKALDSIWESVYLPQPFNFYKIVFYQHMYGSFHIIFSGTHTQQ